MLMNILLGKKDTRNIAKIGSITEPLVQSIKQWCWQKGGEGGGGGGEWNKGGGIKEEKEKEEEKWIRGRKIIEGNKARAIGDMLV